MSVSVPQRPPSPAPQTSPHSAHSHSLQQQHHPTSASSSRSSSPAPTHAADQALADIVSHLTLLSSLLVSPSTDQRSKLDLLLRIIEYSKQCSDASLDLTQLLPDNAHSLFRALRLLTADKDPTLRAQSLRTLRYCVNSQQSVQLFYSLNVDLFLIRSLERDSKYLWERLQAFKLYKRLFALSPSHMSRALVQSILAMAELPKDDFRRVSLHEVREMLLVIPNLVCSCNGLRVLVDSILDPACSDIAGSLALTLLYVLDQPHTRQLLRPSLDITRLLAVFTDTAAPDSPDREARRLAAHRCLVTMMRSWGGILALTEERGGLSSLVGVLSLPMTVKGASWGREAVFDLLLEVVGVVKAHDIAATATSAAHCGHNLLHSYITVILLSLIDCGLLHTLTALSSSLDGEFRGVATKLLLELLALASHLLPASLCRQLNALPSVMASAASFGAEGGGESGRVRALSLINVLSEEGSSSGMSAVGGEWGELHDGVAAGRKDQAVHDIFTSSSSATVQHGIYLLRYMQNTDFLPASMPSSSSSTSSLATSASLLASLRQHVDHSIDDRELETLIKRTMIPHTKDFRQWDTALILSLLEGPLASSQPALITAMTKHKFIKRICSFLRPEKLLFSCMDYTAPHLVYVRIAVALFRVMLACTEGREYAYFVQLVDNIFDTVLGEIGRGRGDEKKSSGGSGKDGSGKDGGSSAHHPHSSSVQYGQHPPVNGSHAHSSSVSSSQRPRLSVDDSDLVGGGGGLSPRHALQHSRTLSRITRNKHKPSYRCLSRPNLKRKLSQAYFLLIGLLSSSRYGMSYFDKFGLYDHLYNLCTDHSKDYLTRCFILHLDYSERTARTLLETWLKGGSVGLRKFAVSFLRSVVRSQPGNSHWMIGMIVAQLTHSDASLRAATLSLLQEMAIDPSYLTLLIKKKPQLSHCGLLAQPLQCLFLSSKAGLEYVGGGSGVVALMRQWKSEGCVRYVESLERCLVSALSADEGKDREGPSGNSGAGGSGQGGPGGGGGGGGSSKAATKTAAAEEKRGNSLQVDKGLAATSVQTSALTTSSSSSNLANTAQAAANNNRSSSPTPSSPPPSSPTPHSPTSAPSLPWFFFAPTPRTSLDDYFLSRLHALPWSVELTADWPNGRTNVLMPTDCYLFSSPYEQPSKDDTELDSVNNGSTTGAGNGGSGGAVGSAACVHPVRTYLVCVLLDSHGQPSPYRLDHSVTMRARLTLGGGQSDRSEPEAISRPSSAAPSALTTPSSSSRHLSSPFRTPTSSPRAGHHSPHLSTSMISLPSMSEYDTQPDDREWMKTYFTYPLVEHVCRPAMRVKANLDSTQSVAVSAGGSGGPTSLRGALHTTTKDDDRCKWAFNLTPAALPPAPRRDRTNSQSAAAATDYFDWMLESLMFPVALPSDGVSSVCVPRHLYGELVQTAEGCELLRQSGCVDDFVRTVMAGEEEWYEGKRARADAAGGQTGSARVTPAASPASMTTSISSHHLAQHSGSASSSSSSSATSTLPSSSNLQKRAALWSLGHIASTSLGLSLLPPDILSFISTSALSHPTLSFRGTCYYLLSLITRSPVGRATLERLGWVMSTNPQVGVVVPSDRMDGGKDFLRIGNAVAGKGRMGGGWATDRSNLYGIPMKGKGTGPAATATSSSTSTASTTLPSSVPPLRSYTDAELDILLHISNLCNYVTQGRSLTSLRAMRQSSSFAPLFSSAALLLDAMRMLAVYSFRLQARRYLLFDLFGGVAFTEQSMAAFDGVFLPTDKSGEAADAARTERDKDNSNKQQQQRLMLSPPVMQARTLPSAGTAAARRTRPLQVNLPPPHSSKPAVPISPMPPTAIAAAAAASATTAAITTTGVVAAAGDSGGKVKAAMSVGRDRSLSVPSRVSGVEYSGAGHDELEEQSGTTTRRGAVVVVGSNGGSDLSGESSSGSPISSSDQSAVLRNVTIGVGSLSSISPHRGRT